MGTGEVVFLPCALEDVLAHIADYIGRNKIIVDSFWEEHLFESNVYKMTVCDEIVGLFAIHDKNTITLFYISPQNSNQSQDLFAKVKKYEEVTNAMVPTGDEFFLSQCLDSFSRIEKQAYFAEYTDREILAPRRIAIEMRLADVDKDYEILAICGDFLEDEIKKIRSGTIIDYLEIYIAEYNGDVVGFGVVEYGRIIKDISSIGMYVCPQFRKKRDSCQYIAAAKAYLFQKRIPCVLRLLVL